MFGEDRFGLDQDYVATCRSHGGQRLALVSVREAITTCYECVDTSRSGRCFH
jgi:hypothetical protein